MKEIKSEKKKSYKIQLNVDLNAVLTGFDTAKTATRAHRRLMKNYSSVLLMGPPRSDDLLELMTHMFTEDEADAAQHLPPLLPRTAAQVARRCGRPVSDVMSTLDGLACNKRVLVAYGKPRMYTILPLVPGTFEIAIITPDISRTNSWHKKFAELFERIWDSAYIKDYVSAGAPLVRYLPTPGGLSTLQMAWPTDRLEEILEPYDVFGIAHCSCRVVTRLVGKGCDKPTENCVGIGPMAQPLIDRGYMRKADRREIIEAKRLAEQHGCVTWMINGQSNKRGNVSCSCCGCCCHALRTVNQFSAPGMISKPHFMPHREDEKCRHCGKCAAVCPMGAWSKIGAAIYFQEWRCIGCGICVSSCKFDALELKPVPDAKPPERDYNTLLLKNLPDFVSNSFRLWLRRNAGI